MSDNIARSFDTDLFLNRGDHPAWHQKGFNGVSLTAVEGLQKWAEASGQPDIFSISKHELKFTLGSGKNRKVMPSGWFVLVRDPLKEGGEYEVIGSPVSGDFETIDPRMTAELWDTELAKGAGHRVEIETMGILGEKADQMFITTKLPKYDVKGEEVQTYLVLHAPFHNGKSITAMTTGVNVVCQNTLHAALRNTIEQFQVTHTTGMLKRASEWIGGMYERSVVASATLAEAYNILAEKKVNPVQVKWIVDNTFRLPSLDVDDNSAAARLPLAVRQEKRDRWISHVETVRAEVQTLIDGAGVGMNHPSRQGTAWGVLNAIGEYETHARTHNVNAVSTLLSGDRAQRIRNGFALAMVSDQYDSVDLTKLDGYRPLCG